MTENTKNTETTDFQKAYVTGVERIAAWSDLLDAINVFPVADGDTGRNLLVSLTPLRQASTDGEALIRRLLLSARGNSGNIAVRFFSGFLSANTIETLPQAARKGRDYAWQSIHQPRTGTMLNVFDSLVEVFDTTNISDRHGLMMKIVDALEDAVRSTTDMIPRLKEAGVVDSGALGMYIYLEGFFKRLLSRSDQFRPLTRVFPEKLQIAASFKEKIGEMYCIDTVIRSANQSETVKQIEAFGKEISIIPHNDLIKIHLHTENPTQARDLMESCGEVVQWTKDDMETQVEQFYSKAKKRAIHMMTDAAGSVTRQDAENWGITLLNSYITVGDESLPETMLKPDHLYQPMRNGIPVATSQASVFERHQCYQSVLNRYPRVLYLCVGSFYTGNYDTVMEWKADNDPDNRMVVIDTGTASGRLGLIVAATVDFASRSDDPQAVVQFAKEAVPRCREYVFLDRLKYLAAGGRLSKTSAFFGDILHKKPIVTPGREGARKVGLVTNQTEQIAFALKQLNRRLEKNARPLIMLEYSDNRKWVIDVVKQKIETRHPFAKIITKPLSLTSGAHMGPGTWAIAFLPEIG